MPQGSLSGTYIHRRAVVKNARSKDNSRAIEQSPACLPAHTSRRVPSLGHCYAQAVTRSPRQRLHLPGRFVFVRYTGSRARQSPLNHAAFVTTASASLCLFATIVTHRRPNLHLHLIVTTPPAPASASSSTYKYPPLHPPLLPAPHPSTPNKHHPHPHHSPQGPTQRNAPQHHTTLAPRSHPSKAATSFGKSRGGVAPSFGGGALLTYTARIGW